MNGIECMVLFSEGCFEDNGCYVGVLRMSLFAHTELPLRTSMQKASWSCLSLPLGVKKKGRVVGNSALGGCMCTHITRCVHTHACMHSHVHKLHTASITDKYIRTYAHTHACTYVCTCHSHTTPVVSFLQYTWKSLGIDEGWTGRTLKGSLNICS